MRFKISIILFSLMVILFSSCKNDKDEIHDSENQHEASPYDLYINEISISSLPDWIEIYNPGTSMVDMSNCKLCRTDNKYIKFTPGTLIQPKQFMIVYLDDTTQPNAFTLPGTTGALSLYDDEGRKVDSIVYPGMPEGVSYGRWPDGSAQWAVNAFPSPGMTNDPATNKPPCISKFRISNNHPIPTETVSISAFFEDEHLLTSGWLRYWYNTTDTTIQFFQVSCGNGEFTAYIPPLPSGTKVNYYIYADDDTGLRTYLPGNAPSHSFSYTVQ